MRFDQNDKYIYLIANFEEILVRQVSNTEMFKLAFAKELAGYGFDVTRPMEFHQDYMRLTLVMRQAKRNINRASGDALQVVKCNPFKDQIEKLENNPNEFLPVVSNKDKPV